LERRVRGCLPRPVQVGAPGGEIAPLRDSAEGGGAPPPPGGAMAVWWSAEPTGTSRVRDVLSVRVVYAGRGGSVFRVSSVILLAGRIDLGHHSESEGSPKYAAIPLPRRRNGVEMGYSGTGQGASPAGPATRPRGSAAGCSGRRGLRAASADVPDARPASAATARPRGSTAGPVARPRGSATVSSRLSSPSTAKTIRG